jgi:hypothetical protein
MVKLGGQRLPSVLAQEGMPSDPKSVPGPSDAPIKTRFGSHVWVPAHSMDNQQIAEALAPTSRGPTIHPIQNRSGQERRDAGTGSPSQRQVAHISYPAFFCVKVESALQ